jgi:leader peptidase (prepilin peptidase) / N-methyltransferase
VAIAAALPLGLYLLSIPFGAGAIAMGDLKLLVSVGLVSGLVRTIVGIVTGTFAVGIVIAVLLVARRVTLRSFIPFGPIIVVGAMWSTLVQIG